MRVDRHVMRRTALLLAVLTVPAMIYASQLYVLYRWEGARIPFSAFVVLQLSHWYLWAIAGPAVWALTLRWPLVGATARANLARHVAAALAIALLVIAVYVAVYEVLHRLPPTRTLLGGLQRTLPENALFFFLAFFHLELLVYAGVAGLAQAAASTSALRAREHETLRLTSELATARLQTLRAQLQPHFLFNTLHTIGSLVLQRKNDRAVQMLAELGDLLRETLERRDADVIPLRDEISHLRRYLRIEEARFGDRLAVTWTIEPETEQALVPSFILQPIVENAFRHGIAKCTDTARLDIRARTDAATLVVDVYNDGPLLPDRWVLGAGTGFGLRNVAARLAARGSGASLQYENAGTTGVRAVLVLPLVNT